MNSQKELSYLLENSENGVPAFWDALAVAAFQRRATDIHIEAQERLRIRLRIDGDLQDFVSADLQHHASLIAHLKVRSKLDIAQKRLPQDGRFSATIDGEEVDFRVSTIPTVRGEKMELRLLNATSYRLAKNDLGITEEQMSAIEKMSGKPHGMVLLCGPTGCGKTTTLYSLLNSMNTAEKNIVTIEDPVEYTIPGISQIQVNPSIGLDFNSGLRAILRQDPDMIMVGEIRDRETADTAVRAAITGNFLFSTLHTNDCFSALVRLRDMGIPAYLISAALNGVVSQRLVKVLCPHCKTLRNFPKEAPLVLNLPEGKEILSEMWDPVGCERCNGGYYGRMAIVELFEFDEDYGELLRTNAPLSKIKQLGREKNVRTLLQNGLEQVRRGCTSLTEVLQVAGSAGGERE